MKKNIIITGATGYIGFKLSQFLQENYQITLLLRGNSQNRHRISAIEDKFTILEYNHYEELDSLFKDNHYDSLIHLATSNHNEPFEKVLDSNLVFSSYLLNSYCKWTKNPSLVNTGTSFSYDGEGNYSPGTFYGATKKAFQDIIEYYSLQENLKAITLNLYDVYGVDDWRVRVFNLILNSLENKTNLCLTEGKEYLNLVNIDDVLCAFEKSLELVLKREEGEKPSHIVYEVTGEETLSLKEIVSCMEESFPHKLQAEWGAFPYPATRVISRPYTQGPRLPGWAPLISLKDSLKKSNSR